MIVVIRKGMQQLNLMRNRIPTLIILNLASKVPRERRLPNTEHAERVAIMTTRAMLVAKALKTLAFVTFDKAL